LRECLLAASVVLDWFSSSAKGYGGPYRRLRAEFESGELEVIAPALIHLEILNVAGRSWRWDAASLEELGEGLDDLLFELIEADLSAVARWIAAGLTAYDAAYVAVAEAAAVPFITNDRTILGIAPRIAQSLQ